MRLLTWNLNFRRDVERQLTAALVQAPDLIVFQEVRRASFDELRQRLAEHGLDHFVTSLDGVQREPIMSRFVVAASRYEFAPAPPSTRRPPKRR